MKMRTDDCVLDSVIVIAILTKVGKTRETSTAASGAPALQSALITSKISCRRSLHAAGQSTRMRGSRGKGHHESGKVEQRIVGIQNFKTIKC